MLTNNWIDGPQYDAWKTTPPDDYFEEKESQCHCSICETRLDVDDEYWLIDDEIYCRECAENWFDEEKRWVSEELAYGE